jgi:purine-binding chemotaxis protein CheW
VQQPTRLNPEDVTWRSERSKRPWLAGTVKAAMCALLDVPQMGRILQSHDRKRAGAAGR